MNHFLPKNITSPHLDNGLGLTGSSLFQNGLVVPDTYVKALGAMNTLPAFTQTTTAADKARRKKELPVGELTDQELKELVDFLPIGRDDRYVIKTARDQQILDESRRRRRERDEKRISKEVEGAERRGRAAGEEDQGADDSPSQRSSATALIEELYGRKRSGNLKHLSDEDISKIVQAFTRAYHETRSRHRKQRRDEEDRQAWLKQCRSYCAALPSPYKEECLKCCDDAADEGAGRPNTSSSDCERASRGKQREVISELDRRISELEDLIEREREQADIERARASQADERADRAETDAKAHQRAEDYHTAKSPEIREERERKERARTRARQAARPAPNPVIDGTSEPKGRQSAPDPKLVRVAKKIAKELGGTFAENPECLAAVLCVVVFVKATWSAALAVGKPTKVYMGEIGIACGASIAACPELIPEKLWEIVAKAIAYLFS